MCYETNNLCTRLFVKSLVGLAQMGWITPRGAYLVQQQRQVVKPAISLGPLGVAITGVLESVFSLGAGTLDVTASGMLELPPPVRLIVNVVWDPLHVGYVQQPARPLPSTLPRPCRVPNVVTAYNCPHVTCLLMELDTLALHHLVNATMQLLHATSLCEEPAGAAATPLVIVQHAASGLHVCEATLRRILRCSIWTCSGR